MYYHILDKIEKINVKQINKEVMTFGLITITELEKHYEKFGFSYITVEECKNSMNNLHGTLNAYNDYLFGIIYCCYNSFPSIDLDCRMVWNELYHYA